MNSWCVPESQPLLPMSTETALARRLRAARLAAGLTGSSVLSKTGIDPGNLSRMEHGRRMPSVAILLALAKLYRIPFGALFEAAAGQEPDAPESLSPGLPVADFVATPDPGTLGLHERHWQDRPDLRENARRFAVDVFEPVRAVLGVPLRVESGYRSPGLDRKVLRGQAPFSAHTHGLAADVVPQGMPLRAALLLIRAAVRRGDLDRLDFAAIESSQWLHIQVAPDLQPARRLVAEAFSC
jgi:transcriptional regulator with XRE-family HTH domain